MRLVSKVERENHYYWNYMTKTVETFIGCFASSQDFKTQNPDLKILNIIQLIEKQPMLSKPEKAMSDCLYIGNIEYSGAITPIPGMEGCGVIRNCLVYSGMIRTFVDAFSHYQAHKDLQRFPALFLDRETLVRLAEDGEIVVLSGGCALIHPYGENADAPVRVEQYMKGESFRP